MRFKEPRDAVGSAFCFSLYNAKAAGPGQGRWPVVVQGQRDQRLLRSTTDPQSGHPQADHGGESTRSEDPASTLWPCVPSWC